MAGMGTGDGTSSGAHGCTAARVGTGAHGLPAALPALQLWLALEEDGAVGARAQAAAPALPRALPTARPAAGKVSALLWPQPASADLPAAGQPLPVPAG